MIDVALTDVCDFQGGTQPPKSEWSAVELPDYIRMLQIRDFTQAKERHIEYVKNKTTLKTCNDEDILIGRYGASIGKILTGLSGAYNVAIVKTIPDTKRLDRNFLLHLLKGVTFQRFIQTVGSRAAQAGFNKKELTKFRFKLPPLAEQQKIAEILDAADSLRQKDQQLIDHYTTLSQSLFLEMFGDPVTNPMGWEKVAITEVSEVVSGNTPKGIDDEYGDNFSIPFFRVGDMNILGNETKMSFSRNNIRLEVAERLNLKVCAAGTIIFPKRGASIYTNKKRILTKPSTFDLNTMGLLPKPMINNIYFYYWFSQFDLSSLADGSSVPQLNNKQIKPLKTIKPPLGLQNQFAERIQAIESQKQQAQASLEKSNDLFNSLLQKAFKGELNG